MTVVHPESVFTPRASNVNERMYVDRPQLELALERGLRGSMHLVLYGDSGSGKSWLYKRVLAKTRSTHLIANLANASRLGSITEELKNIVSREGHIRQTGYSEGKSAEANAVVAKGALSHTKNFEIGQMEPLEAALAFLNRKARGKPSVLVLDNLEAAFDTPMLMRELADLIILLDDPRYAQYQVQFLIVGVPRQVRDYFAQTPNRRTVSNRLQELPEVARLRKAQVDTLVRRGFVTELRYRIADSTLARTSEHVFWVTSGVPQRVHEYCLQLAYATEYEGSISPEDLDMADSMWLSDALADCYDVIERAMNNRETVAGRRNQTLYALGKIAGDEFRSAEVEQVVRKQFPNSTRAKGLNIGAILADLERREPPVLTRSFRGDAFRFADPRYRMCIRAMLRVAKSETVRRIEMDSFGES